MRAEFACKLKGEGCIEMKPTVRQVFLTASLRGASSCFATKGRMFKLCVKGDRIVEEVTVQLFFR